MTKGEQYKLHNQVEVVRTSTGRLAMLPPEKGQGCACGDCAGLESGTAEPDEQASKVERWGAVPRMKVPKKGRKK